MKRISWLITSLGLILSAHTAIAADTPVVNQSAEKKFDRIQWSVSWGMIQNGSQYNIGIGSPVLFRWGYMDRSWFSIYAEYGAIDIVNGYRDSNSNFQTANNEELGIGFRLTTDVRTAHGYFQLGYDHIGWDSHLNPDGNSQSNGLLASIGAELAEAQGESFRTCYFIQADDRSGHDRVDKVAGKPQFFDGVAFRLGVRFQY